MSAKSINLEAINPSEKKHNLPLVNQPSSLHYRVMELKFELAYQPVALKQEVFFTILSAKIQKQLHQDGF